MRSPVESQEGLDRQGFGCSKNPFGLPMKNKDDGFAFKKLSLTGDTQRWEVKKAYSKEDLEILTRTRCGTSWTARYKMHV